MTGRGSRRRERAGVAFAGVPAARPDLPDKVLPMRMVPAPATEPAIPPSATVRRSMGVRVSPTVNVRSWYMS